MATVFSDNFDRADGALGANWTTAPAGDVVVSGNTAAAVTWDASAFRDIGMSDGYRVSASFSEAQWPGMLVRNNGADDYWIVRSAALELVRRQGGSTVLDAGPTDPGGTITLWCEVREIAAGTELTWGYGSTTIGTVVDDLAGRPAGTRVGFLSQPNGALVDNFLVETLETTTTTTTIPPLPETIVPGVTVGHLGHHDVLHSEAAVAGTPVEGGGGHLGDHAELKSWHDAAHPGSPLPVVTDGNSHAAAHEKLHAWVNDGAPTTTTTTTAATTTTTTTVGGGGGFLSGDSILHPTYVGDGSVFQRSVASMPLASNSAQMAAYMRQDQINTGYGTAFNLYQYNFPTYIVRSSELSPADVTWRDMRAWGWTPVEMMGTVFSKGPHNPELNTPAFAPIPEYAVPAVGTDSSMAIYDADTDTLWEWWQIEKIGIRQWHAEWGSRTLNASNKYSGQADVGSVCAAGLMGSLLQIGVGEAQNGWIDHALGIVILAPKQGISWPARQNDGWVTDVNAPTQGQWARLDPALDIEAQPWNPLLKMVCRAVQTYGMTCFDKGGAVSFTGESGAHHQEQTGVDPWAAILADSGVPEWEVFNQFPWESTQWAPIDWGKPA